MHILTVIRAYLGVSQTVLAKAVGITQPDLSEIETMPPYGKLPKYQRLSEYLGIPVDALVKNDFTQIPLSFFDAHPSQKYQAAPVAAGAKMGRDGEEFILRREQERLSRHFPALAQLILPYFKMKGPSPGYDILSFDDFGKPFALEVKTSLYSTGVFRFTAHELEVARHMVEMQQRYVVCYISGWGTPEQTEQDLAFADLLETHQFSFNYSYYCTPIPKQRAEVTTISGLCHYRQMRGLRQADIADMLGIQPGKWSLYENGHAMPSVDIFLKASEFLDTTIDDLLRTYPYRAEERHE